MGSAGWGRLSVRQVSRTWGAKRGPWKARALAAPPSPPPAVRLRAHGQPVLCPQPATSWSVPKGLLRTSSAPSARPSSCASSSTSGTRPSWSPLTTGERLPGPRPELREEVCSSARTGAGGRHPCAVPISCYSSVSRGCQTVCPACRGPGPPLTGQPPCPCLRAPFRPQPPQCHRRVSVFLPVCPSLVFHFPRPWTPSGIWVREGASFLRPLPFLPALGGSR